MILEAESVSNKILFETFSFDYLTNQFSAVSLT